ncbi:hypothetical protein AAMO2058_000479100 [Amorphochlora amoebiformis]
MIAYDLWVFYLAVGVSATLSPAEVQYGQIGKGVVMDSLSHSYVCDTFLTKGLGFDVTTSLITKMKGSLVVWRKVPSSVKGGMVSLIGCELDPTEKYIYAFGYSTLLIPAASSFQVGKKQAWLAKVSTSDGRLIWSRIAGSKALQWNGVATGQYNKIWVFGSDSIKAKRLSYDSTGTAGNILSHDISSWDGVTTDFVNGNQFAIGTVSSGYSTSPKIGKKDGLLVKFDSSGNEVWHDLQGVKSANTFYTSVTYDPVYKMIYVAARMGGKLDPKFRTTGFLALGILAFNSSGSRQWVKQFGSVSEHTYPTCISVSPNGRNVFAGGYTKGNYDGFIKSGLKDMIFTRVDNLGNKIFSYQHKGNPSHETEIGRIYVQDTEFFILGAIKAGPTKKWIRTYFKTAYYSPFISDDVSCDIAVDDDVNGIWVDGIPVKYSGNRGWRNTKTFKFHPTTNITKIAVKGYDKDNDTLLSGFRMNCTSEKYVVWNDVYTHTSDWLAYSADTNGDPSPTWHLPGSNTSAFSGVCLASRTLPMVTSITGDWDVIRPCTSGQYSWYVLVVEDKDVTCRLKASGDIHRVYVDGVSTEIRGTSSSSVIPFNIRFNVGFRSKLAIEVINPHGLPSSCFTSGIILKCKSFSSPSWNRVKSDPFSWMAYRTDSTKKPPPTWKNVGGNQDNFTSVGSTNAVKCPGCKGSNPICANGFGRFSYYVVTNTAPRYVRSSPYGVACELSVDEKINNVYLNNATLPVLYDGPVMANWRVPKAIAFTPKADVSRLAIKAEEYDDLGQGCTNSGMWIECYSKDHPEWNGVVSDIPSWFAYGTNIATNNPTNWRMNGKPSGFKQPCLSNTPMKDTTRNWDPIWASTGEKYSLMYIDRPKLDVSCNFKTSGKVMEVYVNDQPAYVFGKQRSKSLKSFHFISSPTVKIGIKIQETASNCSKSYLMLSCSSSTSQSLSKILSDETRWKTYSSASITNNPVNWIKVGVTPSVFSKPCVSKAQDECRECKKGYKKIWDSSSKEYLWAIGTFYDKEAAKIGCSNPAKYFRLIIKNSRSTNKAIVNKISLTDAQGKQIYPKIVTDNCHANGSSAANAFDGSTSTKWETCNNYHARSAAVNFQTEYETCLGSITTEQNGDILNRVKTFILKYSLDGMKYKEDWRADHMHSSASMSEMKPTISPSTQPTSSPSTISPTSTSPITSSPVTSSPSTHPTTLSPVTCSPSTHPTTSSPVTCSPSTHPTSSPATSSPSTHPTTSSPATSSPSTHPTSSPSTHPTSSPSTHPVSFHPVSSSPVTMSPISAHPGTYSPVTISPASAHPGSSHPTTLSPVTPTPVTMSPRSTHPGTSSPVTISPASAHPGSSHPATSSPVTPTPVTMSPASAHPGSSHPATSSPVTRTPATMSPRSAHPGTSSPATTSPASSHPASFHPGTANPQSKSPLLEPTHSPESPHPTTCHPTTSNPTLSTLSPTLMTISPTLSPITVSPSSSPASVTPTMPGETFAPTRSPATVAPSTVTPITKSPGTKAPTCTGNPSVTLPSNGFLHQDASEAVYIPATMQLPTCLSDTSSYISSVWKQLIPTDNLGRWKKYTNAIHETSVPILNTISSSLMISKGFLEIGLYAFEINATTYDGYGDNRGSTIRRLILNVTAKPVVAILEGSSIRQASLYPLANYSLKFSAFGSYDPANSTADPTLIWSISEEYSTSRPLPRIRASGYTAIIKSNELVLGTNYSVKVRVEGKRGRMAVAEQRIITVGKEAPVLSLKLSQSRRTSVNSDKRIGIRAKVSNMKKKSLIYSWSCTSGNAILSDLRLTSGQTSNFLGFAPRTLSKGTVYTFALTVSVRSTGVSTTESITFETNRPPSGGSCDVSPRFGYVQVTDFTAVCSNWIDIDAPLRYQFESFDNSTAKSSIFCTYQTPTYCVMSLAPSPSSDNTTVKITVQDSLGSEADPVYIPVMVQFKETFNSADAASAAANAAQSGDMLSVAGSVSIVSSYIQSNNSIDKQTLQTTAEKMLSAIAVVSSQPQVTAANAVTAPLKMVQTMTTASNAPVLSTAAVKLAVNVVESVTKSTLNDLTDPKNAQDTLNAVSNVLVNLKSSDSTSDTEKNEISSKISAVLTKVAGGLSSKGQPGESAVTVESDNVKMYSKVVEPASLSNGKISSGGASLYFPSDMTSEIGTAETQLLMIGLTDRSIYQNPFNSSENDTWKSWNAGILIIDFQVGGTSLDISNMTKPVTISLPSNYTSTQSKNGDAICIYWDEERQTWNRTGLARTGLQVGPSGHVNCSTTHFTTFSAGMKHLSSDDSTVNVNTFGDEDINADTFSLNNIVMILSGVVAFIYILLLFVFITQDAHIARTKGDRASAQFWRAFNRMRRLRMQSNTRKFSNFHLVTKWGMQRGHPWISTFARHPGDFMTSTKRLTILAVLLFNTMTITALLMGQKQKLGFLSVRISIALVSMMFAFPIPSAVTFIFRRTVPSEFAVPLRDHHTTGILIWIFLLFGLICGDVLLEDFEGADDDQVDGNDDDAVVDAEEGDDGLVEVEGEDVIDEDSGDGIGGGDANGVGDVKDDGDVNNVDDVRNAEGKAERPDDVVNGGGKRADDVATDGAVPANGDNKAVSASGENKDVDGLRTDGNEHFQNDTKKSKTGFTAFNSVGAAGGLAGGMAGVMAGKRKETKRTAYIEAEDQAHRIYDGGENEMRTSQTRGSRKARNLRSSRTKLLETELSDAFPEQSTAELPVLRDEYSIPGALFPRLEKRPSESGLGLPGAKQSPGESFVSRSLKNAAELGDEGHNRQEVMKPIHVVYPAGERVNDIKLEGALYAEIVAMKKGGRCERAGVERGMRLVSINGRKIISVDAAKLCIQSHKRLSERITLKFDPSPTAMEIDLSSDDSFPNLGRSVFDARVESSHTLTNQPNNQSSVKVISVATLSMTPISDRKRRIHDIADSGRSISGVRVSTSGSGKKGYGNICSAQSSDKITARSASFDEANGLSREKLTKRRVRRMSTANMRTLATVEDHVYFSTHQWTFWDKLGMTFSILVVLGCWFVLSVLSWTLRHEISDWPATTLITFGQDVTLRIVQIVLLEAVFFLPCGSMCCFLCVLCGCMNPKNQRDETGKQHMFEAGYLGFHFDEGVIVKIDHNSPAEKSGIVLGMKILMINGVPVTNDKEIIKNLHIVHRTHDRFFIRFSDPPKFMRSDERCLPKSDEFLALSPEEKMKKAQRNHHAY